MMKLIEQHPFQSRTVDANDLQRVLNDTNGMYQLMLSPHGLYNVFYAISHAQITKDDPLRFFVLHEALAAELWGKEEADITPSDIAIVNPVIAKHTRHTIPSYEGCMTFPNTAMVKVKRYNKCTVLFKAIETDEQQNPVGLSKPHTMNLSGRLAKVFQHEVDHMNAVYIYDNL